MKYHVCEAFSSLQNTKACFWSVFKFYKMKEHVFETCSYSQNEKACFWNLKHYKMKTRFWSVFIFTKWKTHKLLKHFSSLQTKKHVFSSISKFTTWKNTFLKRFSSLQHGNYNLFLNSRTSKFWGLQIRQIMFFRQDLHGEYSKSSKDYV